MTTVARYFFQIKGRFAPQVWGYARPRPAAQFGYFFNEIFPRFLATSKPIFVQQKACCARAFIPYEYAPTRVRPYSEQRVVITRASPRADAETISESGR
jgi:hypothetical protein